MVEVLVLKKVSCVICAALMAGAFVACSSNQSAPEATADAAGAAMKPEAAHEQAAAPAAVQTITGPVLETMNAANYTYVRVKGPSGDVWGATATFNVAVGDIVVVPLDMPMENFESKTLNRTFPVIYFSSQITKEGEAPAGMGAMAAALPPGHDPLGSQRAEVTEVIPQPAGGTTVASLWEKRNALAGKSVTVRGKVVKFNGGILGKNWMHIQDGTGTEKDGTNDVTVTSDAAGNVGDIVTITGTLVLDKDFGAGYAYKLIIENATVVPK